MIDISDYITLFSKTFNRQGILMPWEFTNNLPAIIIEMINNLDNKYAIHDGIAIHKTATIEKGAILKAPIIIGADCFIAANAYLRGGVYLAAQVKVGTGVEIKSSIIFNNTSIAHFNFIGDSIIGGEVNVEAGAIIANHYNERANKNISVIFNAEIINTGVIKFGALVGDKSRIGANAVLSPGTILSKNSIVKRLELVDQQNQV